MMSRSVKNVALATLAAVAMPATALQLRKNMYQLSYGLDNPPANGMPARYSSQANFLATTELPANNADEHLIRCKNCDWYHHPPSPSQRDDDRADIDGLSTNNDPNPWGRVIDADAEGGVGISPIVTAGLVEQVAKNGKRVDPHRDVKRLIPIGK